MAPTETNAEFFFQGNAVGILRDSAPRVPGEWRYEPYRGPGHYELARAIRDGKGAVCELEEDGGKIRFVVVGVPRYGIIAVGEILGSD